MPSKAKSLSFVPETDEKSAVEAIDAIVNYIDVRMIRGSNSDGMVYKKNFYNAITRSLYACT
jgi:hypothetical protein